MKWHKLEVCLFVINFKNSGLPVPFKTLQYGCNHKLVNGKFEESLEQFDKATDK